jgi:hypothetical protein
MITQEDVKSLVPGEKIKRDVDGCILPYLSYFSRRGISRGTRYLYIKVINNDCVEIWNPHYCERMSDDQVF